MTWRLISARPYFLAKASAPFEIGEPPAPRTTPAARAAFHIGEPPSRAAATLTPAPSRAAGTPGGRAAFDIGAPPSR